MFIKAYCDLQKLTSFDEVKESVKAHGILFASHENIMNLFELYEQDRQTRMYKYTGAGKTGKVYSNIFGYSIEILVPRTLKTVDYKSFAELFTKQLFKNEKIPYLVIDKFKGNGRYLEIIYLTRRYLKKADEVILHKKTIYRDKYTGKMCKKTNENAVAQETYKVVTTMWSMVTRIFSNDTKNFTEFLKSLNQYVNYALQRLGVVVKNARFLKGLKHKRYTHDKITDANYLQARTIYYNQNIAVFNEFIYEMNYELTQHYEMLFGGGKYYQDPELMGEFYSIVERFRAYIRKKHDVKTGYDKRFFNYKPKGSNFKGQRCVIEPAMNTETFKENMGTLKFMFDEAISSFDKKWIFS